MTLDESAQLRDKARFGAFALTARMIVLQAIAFAGDVYLRRVLSPADFGIFVIAQFLMTFFAFWGDAGLGGALIQQRDEPSDRELSSVFALQMLLSCGVAALMAFGAPALVRFWPDLSPDAVWVFRALSVNLVLIAARVVPSMLMERHLQFGRLSVLEVLLTVPFYATAVWMAHRQHGVFALVAAVLAQGVFGVAGAFIMRPWRPRLVLDREVLRPVLGFGIAYQFKNFIGFFTGAIAPLYAGRVLGQTQLGFIDWAQRTAYLPLRLVQVMARIGFPLFSRLQHDERRFALVLDRVIQVCAMGTLMFIGVCFAVAPNLIRVLYTEKWLPALPMFYVFAATLSVGFIAPLVQPAIDALGKPQINLIFSLSWTAAMWIIAPLTTARWGATGFAIGIAVPAVVGNLVLMIYVKRLIPDAHFWRRGRASVVAAVFTAAIGRTWLAGWATTAPSLALAVLALMLTFIGIVIALDRSAARDAISLLRPATNGAV